MRAADADRQQIADQLKAALDEGRLSLHEYDDRVGAAYAARTYAELMVIVQDLPRPGLSNSEVAAQKRRADRRLPTALIVLWTIWGALAAVNVVIYALVAVTAGLVYPWPIWLLVPGAALGAVTVGVQVIRNQTRN
ncbi:DUF1707 domain-containing protein [Actinoplanes sp. NEAU-A12]|uniref:DUF1707 domain-containing protein n=1 Tax=Actinoplanes sandaracinus TaxID=3045177 RepID=A0ABT6WFV2_9ACTN|nr:DUF1707 domain-containing protein [Actinoplanes sandaracinus]MDI6098599.1 DUF1707 domain-containing protein [Actinoplanes sandaracinus]